MIRPISIMGINCARKNLFVRNVLRASFTWIGPAIRPDNINAAVFNFAFMLSGQLAFRQCHEQVLEVLFLFLESDQRHMLVDERLDHVAYFVAIAAEI